MSGPQNGRASKPLLEREDTPEAGLSMMPLVREAVAGGNLAQAVLITANVAERSVTHSHIAAERAETAIHEARKTREAAEQTQAQLAQHRADTHVELDSLGARFARELGHQATATKELREAIGTWPLHLDPHVSKTGEHTAEELVELERGTGLAGVIGRMRAEQSRAAKRTALGLGSVAALTPVLIELIKALL